MTRNTSIRNSSTGAEQDRAHRGPSLEELHQQLADAVADLQTGEQWRAWLDFAGKLHRYSFKNLILIWAQRPDATAVASYRTWQALDRQVRRGEHALRVIAPITRRPKTHDMTSTTTATSAPAASIPAASIPTTSTRADADERIVGFRAVPVFDISQTDGPPVPRQPEAQLLTGVAVAGLWDALAAEVGERGYRLLRGSLADLHGANGVTKIIEREVWVRDDVSPAQAAKTLAHELGHVLLHTNQVTTDSGVVEVDAAGLDALRCAGIREVEAESVAHLVLAHHGIDTGSYTFPYVATWAHPIATTENVPLSDIVTRVGNRVTRAAADLITATTPAETIPDPAIAGVAARVNAATSQVTDLHDRVTRHHDPNPARNRAPDRAPAISVEERGALLGVVADSHDYFRGQLDRSWVRPYLTSRGLDAAIDPYGIGYAARGWTGLVDHLRNLGYADTHIEASGMASRTGNGQLIDRFRDRLTIPLHDAGNDLIAFTGRARPDTVPDDVYGTDRGEVRGGEVPKYLNSPTTPLYRKSEVLFGLRQQVPLALAPVICEGPLDAIAIDQTAQAENLKVYGVATVGTALTDQHAQMIRTAATSLPVHLAFDGDPAGVRATEAAWRQLTSSGPQNVRVVELPTGTDPAALAHSAPDQLIHSLATARPAAAVIAERHLADAPVDGNILKEVAAFRELSGYAPRMPIDQRPGFLLGLAGRLRIDPTDAATMAADHNPNVMLERVTQQAHQVAAAITATTEQAAATVMEDDRYRVADAAALSAAR